MKIFKNVIVEYTQAIADAGFLYSASPDRSGMATTVLLKNDNTDGHTFIAAIQYYFPDAVISTKAAVVFETVCYPFRIQPPIYRRRLDFFTKDRAFDISKAKKLLGYKPEVDLKSGLKITGDWYRENNLL